VKLSFPVYSLKRKARELAKAQALPLHQALDIVAGSEGFNSWSLLAARYATEKPAIELLASIKSGELVLVGARPGQGKTLFSLELIVNAIESGNSGYFFTLEWNITDIIKCLSVLGTDLRRLKGKFEFDNSDFINADYIVDCLDNAASLILKVRYENCVNLQGDVI